VAIFKVSTLAGNDLFDIGKYTEDLWVTGQRNKYLDDIDNRFHELAINPDYPTSKSRKEIREGCFSVFVNEHVIIYRKFNYDVRIVRVLNQSMDIKQYL
jgi:toxin ParE1/3/4